MIEVINNIATPTGDGTSTNEIGFYFRIRKYDFAGVPSVKVQILGKKLTDIKYLDVTSSCKIQRCQNRGPSETLDTSSIEIKSENFGEEFKVIFTPSVIDLKSFYIRVYSDEHSMISEKLYVSIGKNTLSFESKKIQLGEKQPTKIKVQDDLTCFDKYVHIIDGALKNEKQITLQVLATNNANDTSPVWENITESYLNGSLYEFTNSIIKDPTKWAVAVKYSVTKLYPSDATIVNNIKINTVSISTL